jgi:putative ABC transport system permease protein
MREVTLASVRVYARRYVAAVVAVTLAVAFVVTTNALTSATKAGLVADLATSFRGAEVVTAGLGGVAEADRVVRAAEDAGGVAAVNALAWTPVSVGGQRIADDAQVGTIASGTATGLRWQTLVEGAYPRPGEVVVDEHEAAARGVAVGDTVTLGRGEAGLDVVVSGTVASSIGPHGASAYVTWPDFATIGETGLLQDVVARGVTVDALDGALPPRYDVQPVDDHLAAAQKEMTQGVDVIAVMLLVFAAIALFVSVLVIANTFTVLLAQRQRDFALLRCVGATRRQVLRAVRLEALLVGAASATLGLLVGTLLGHGLVAVASALFPAVPVGAVELSPVWLGGGWLLGVLVTLGASLLPARRGSRVAPLAALRPDHAVVVRSRAGRGRIALAALALWVGSALLWFSVTSHQLAPMLAGGFVSFVGVLLLGPIVVPLAIRLVGVVLGRVAGTAGRLAVANAVRNPRRTAATAASLLVGVTLITGMVVGMATIRTTVDEEMDRQYPLDLTLTGTRALADGLADDVRAIKGVDAVVPVPGATVELTGKGLDLGATTVLAPPSDLRGIVRGDPAFVHPEPGEVYLPWEAFGTTGYSPDTTVTALVDGERVRLRARVADGIGDVAVVAPRTLDGLVSSPAEPARALWIRADDGADAEDVTGALAALARATGTEAAGGFPDRAWVDLQLDVMLRAVVAMLAVGVLIAVVGVGSTLGLSVLERTREHALLRALGLTRRRLRFTLSAEAVLLAGVAGVLGAVLGTVYAWIGVEAVVGEAIGQVSLVVPWAQVVLIAVTAAVAGLVAGVLPSRRAATVSPAAGLAAD